MSNPRYSADDFQNALLALLPPGTIWSRSPDSGVGNLFRIPASLYQRNSDSAVNLISDLNPETTNHFLTEWEKTLGLPDCCTAKFTSFEERRLAVLSKLSDQGGSSIRYYVDFIKKFGVNIEIQEFAQARAGFLRAGEPLYGDDWAFAWQVTLPKTIIKHFTSGHSSVGDPLRSWNDGVLECLIRTHAPAHTIVFFNYRNVTSAEN